MAMMMTGRVLLVYALCVLWCGIAGGVCAEGEDAADVGTVSGGEVLSKNTQNEMSPSEVLGSQNLPSGDEDKEKKKAPEEKLITLKGLQSPQVPEELKEKDKTGLETHKVEKKEKAPQTKTSTVQITTLATTQIPEVKLPEGIPAKAGPEEDVSLTGSNDAQKLTQQRHENSSSQTEKTAEAPDPPATKGVPPQKAQETTTENSMESVTGDSPPESTETFISTSGRSEAQSTENGNDAQQSNPNESHGDLEGGDIHTAPTASEAAPQTAETAIIARTNGTTTPGYSDGSTVKMSNATVPGDSDGGTAASRSTSPLLLLLLVVCAAAAAVVAA
ncbi:mucin-associated surface protein (MASP), putative [Trypanosoma cruzi marinkellei]|uniref:Mucin-associated surface protein (MASP), putative n=1 Tax=Trypanosoma cruzi marinkellei TaxID=85056 RepID=K2MUG4_TRYCR|nr:mucin-associated surface protein (MASP), putative [Trypanosoma cruzi marinkellei]